jgi:hypothetical protein
MPPPVPAAPRPWRSAGNNAFYLDEEDTAVDPLTQCPLNKLGKLSLQQQVDNPLDASIAANVTGRPDPLPRPEKIPKALQGVSPADPTSRPWQTIFASQTFRDHPPDMAKVSLLFGVGPEVNLLGLGHFFETSPDRVLIVVSGREAGWISPAAAWAIGITSQQIDALFTATHLAKQKWQVEIIAGYSTGYRGVNGTINNKLVPLGELKTVILYDALYDGSEPSPGGNTQLMLKSLAAGVKVVVYDVTAPGTPHPFEVKLPADAITVDLKTNRHSFYALVLARVLEKGVKDKYVKPAEVPPAIQNLINSVLPARGTLASSAAKKAVATAGTLDEWAALHPDVATAGSDPVVNKAYAIIRDRLLMNWAMGAAGGMLHAGVIPEFGWEFLARDP